MYFLIVGSLDGFLQSYVEAYKYKNLTTLEWKEFFLNFFEEQVCECDITFFSLSKLTCLPMQAKQGVFAGVEWDKWFYQPGLPPYTPKYVSVIPRA